MVCCVETREPTDRVCTCTCGVKHDVIVIVQLESRKNVQRSKSADPGSKSLAGAEIVRALLKLFVSRLICSLIN